MAHVKIGSEKEFLDKLIIKDLTLKGGYGKDLSFLSAGKITPELKHLNLQ
jgi:hypothetical protein